MEIKLFIQWFYLNDYICIVYYLSVSYDSTKLVTKNSEKRIEHLEYTKSELGELLIEAQKGSYYEFGELSQYVRDISESYFLTKYEQKELTKIDDVGDLTNSVFLAFAEEYKNIENFGYWLRRMLFITFIRWDKKRKIRNSKKLNSIMSTGNNGTEDKELVAAQLTKVLNSLTEEKQKIVRLRFWAHLDFKQIAEYLNKNESVVRKSYYNTLLALKNRLSWLA